MSQQSFATNNTSFNESSIIYLEDNIFTIENNNLEAFNPRKNKKIDYNDPNY